jgi:hypothetical protein
MEHGDRRDDDMRDEDLRDEDSREPGAKESAAPTINAFGRRIRVPRSRRMRIASGSALIIGGVLGFLPVLGFWMVPTGLLVLSYDVPAVRRWRRRAVVWWHRRRGGA